jgi:CTP-dependent riboflavin kinase
MARFIALELPGAQGQTVHVNVDQIRVLRPEVKETAIIFDDKHKVVVEGTADHILTLARL